MMAEQDVLPPDIAEQVLKEFLQTQPFFYSDERLVFTYMQALQQVFQTMTRRDCRASQKHLSPIFSILSEILLVENHKVQLFARNFFLQTIEDHITTSLWEGESDNLEHGLG